MLYQRLRSKQQEAQRDGDVNLKELMDSKHEERPYLDLLELLE